MRRIWTAFETQLLNELAAKGHNASEMAPQIGRTETSIRTRASKIGLKLNKRGRRYALPPGNASTWNQAERLCAFANVPLPLAEHLVAVAEIKGLQVSQIRSESRARDLVRLRANIAKKARANGYTFEAIGRALNRDHTTIIYLVAA